jgi:hypothetical protein
MPPSPLSQVTLIWSIRVSQSRQRGARGGAYESKQEEAKKFEEPVAPKTDEPFSSEPPFVQPSSVLCANEEARRYDCSVDAKD